MAAKYYAVRVGRSTGVFLTWAECQKQVTGFPGAVFKSFTTKEEAENFVKGIVPQIEESGEQILKAEPGALVAYVDGSYNVANNQFSYGMVLLDGEQELKFQQFFIDEELASMRNVAGEIKGAEAAMRYAVEQGKKNYLYTHTDTLAYRLLEKWGLRQYFSDAIDGSMDFPRKPAPDALLYLMEKNQMNPAETLMVGDRDIDIDAGHNAGAAGCLYDYENFYTDAKADHFVQKLAEIKAIL